MEICYCCCNKCNRGMLWARLPLVKLNINSSRYFCCMTYKTNREHLVKTSYHFKICITSLPNELGRLRRIITCTQDPI